MMNLIKQEYNQVDPIMLHCMEQMACILDMHIKVFNKIL